MLRAMRQLAVAAAVLYHFTCYTCFEAVGALLTFVAVSASGACGVIRCGQHGGRKTEEALFLRDNLYE